MSNKNNIKLGAQILALVLWALVVIISCAGLWNAAAGEKPTGFYIGASVLLFIINGVAIYFCAKSITKTLGK